MMRTEFRSDLLGERYRLIRHETGLRIYVFPKKMTTTYALLASAYGSLDYAALTGGKKESFPDGVAHFLEHKLFENEDGSDAFAHFSAIGADANAYTTYNRTAYLFSCTEQFTPALEELLRFVTHPHFTEESVEREKSIIAEEIRMYEDSPWERVFQELLRAMYREHPVRRSICGTVRSIGRITPSLLYRAHELFYHPSNMVLVVCGDVAEDEILTTVDRTLYDLPAAPMEMTRIKPREDGPVYRSYTETEMQVSKPIFCIGIKDPALPDATDARLRRDLSMTLLNEILFSQSGAFYSELFEEGLITPSFSHGYSVTEGFGFNCLTGESDEPERVEARLWKYLEQMAECGIDDEAFQRARRVLYADEVRAYDSTEEIANRLLSFVLEGGEMLAVPDVIRSITREELDDLLRTFYQKDKSTLSVVRPLRLKNEKEECSKEENHNGNEN